MSGSWFNEGLLPVDHLIFRSDIAVVGQFRCATDNPLFRDSGPIRNHVFVFPRTTVAIRHAGSSAFVAGPNLVTFYNRGQEYTRRAIGADKSDDCEWFALAPDILLDVCRRHDSRVSANPDRPFTFEHAPSTAAIYLRQRRLVDGIQRGLIDAPAAEEQVMTILDWLLRSASASCRTPEPMRQTRDRVEVVKTILARSVGAPLSLRDLARSTETSVFYLCRLFREQTGFSIHQYRQQLRLRQALDEVAGSRDLLDTALSLGYSSHSHFTAAFRRAFGLTPSAFRRLSRPSSSVPCHRRIAPDAGRGTSDAGP